MTIDPALSLLLRLALASLFAAAAVHKLRDLPSFRAVLGNYRIVPAPTLSLFAWLVPCSEVSLAAGLLLPSAARPAALAAGLLLGLYAVAIGVNLIRGRRDLDCGCVGFAGRGRLSWALLGRNGVLILAALAAALPVSPRPFAWVDAVTVVAGGLLLALMYAAADTLIANAPLIATPDARHATPVEMR